MPNPQFSYDEIQQRAYAIYQRQGGVHGDPNADWQQAIQELEEERLSKKNHLLSSRLNCLLVRLEKEAIEPAANWLDNADIFRILDRLSPVIEALGVIAGAIIIPIVIWQVGERAQESQEQQEKAIRAQTALQNYFNQLSNILATGKLETDGDLQTIVRASTLALLDSPDLQPDLNLDNEKNWRNDRKGQTIEYLVEMDLIQVAEPQQSQSNNQTNVQEESVISLVGANLSGINLSGVYLGGVDLSFANLSFANLNYDVTYLGTPEVADLSNANLNNTNLSNAYLQFANLTNAYLRESNLTNAYLEDADLIDADLSDADLSSTNLSFANLSDADLSSANLSFANLSDADLSFADLGFANLKGANLKGAYLVFADIRNVQNWTERQLNHAKLCNAELPEGTTLNSDRDCAELFIPEDCDRDCGELLMPRD